MKQWIKEHTGHVGLYSAMAAAAGLYTQIPWLWVVPAVAIALVVWANVAPD